MQRWNDEIEQLLRILIFFRERAKAYSARDALYVLDDDYELHYARKRHIIVGGIKHADSYTFAVELVEPAPTMMVYPNVFLYYAGTYRPVFNLAHAKGWRR